MRSQPIRIQLGKILREILAGKSCGKLLQENLAGKFAGNCGKILREIEIFAGKSWENLGKFLRENLVLREILAGKLREILAGNGGGEKAN